MMYLLPRRLHVTVCLVLGAEGSRFSTFFRAGSSCDFKRGGLCIARPRDGCRCCPLAVVDIASKDGSFQGDFVDCSVVFLCHGGQWRVLRIARSLSRWPVESPPYSTISVTVAGGESSV